MNLTWNPPQSQLNVYKETPTYTVYYTKQRVWSQIVKQTGEFVEPHCLLFENGIYKGPEMDGINRHNVFTDEQMKQIADSICSFFQNKEVKKIWWVSYS